MDTQTKFRQNLPILQHFDTDKIATSVGSFRKGEKGMYNILRLLVFGAIGYFSWLYVLPQLFQALGKVIAIGGTIAAVVALILLAPVIFKGIKRFTRTLHKALIKHDPFAELEAQKQKMLFNKEKFRKAKGKISSLKSEMEVESHNNEKEAEALQTKLTSARKSIGKLKSELDKTEKGSDKYYDLTAKIHTELSDANRTQNRYDQAKDFVRSYGSRANILGKLDNKLKLVGVAMESKILDFDATIDILKKDYEFAQKSREATESAKSAMLFDKSWELEFALDVVTTTIAQDIAITAGNLADIDTITSTYAMDEDEMYEKLNLLTDNIDAGAELIPDSKSYTRPDYDLSHEDKMSSGGFGDMFNN